MVQSRAPSGGAICAPSGWASASLAANEHWNAEAGQVWLERARDQWASHIWINPVPEKYWGYTHSIQMIQEIFENAMVPMTLEGLERGMKELTR